MSYSNGYRPGCKCLTRKCVQPTEIDDRVFLPKHSDRRPQNYCLINHGVAGSHSSELNSGLARLGRRQWVCYRSQPCSPGGELGYVTPPRSPVDRFSIRFPGVVPVLGVRECLYILLEPQGFDNPRCLGFRQPELQAENHFAPRCVPLLPTTVKNYPCYWRRCPRRRD